MDGSRTAKAEEAEGQLNLVEDVESGTKEVGEHFCKSRDCLPLLTTCNIQSYTEAEAETAISPAAERALLWKQDMRIVPLSAAIYFLCYLDRSNIGNAKILNSSTHDDLMSETGMTNYQYTISLMVFLVAYGLFEVPSNGTSVRPPPTQHMLWRLLTRK